MRRRALRELRLRRQGKRQDLLHLNSQQLRALAYPPRVVKGHKSWMR